MKPIPFVLVFAALCAGCNDNSDKLNAISAQLSEIQKDQLMICTNEYYLWNEVESVRTNAIACQNGNVWLGNFYFTNTISAMVGQEASIERNINAETRRVGVIIYTNVMNSEYDTLNTVSQVLKAAGQ